MFASKLRKFFRKLGDRGVALVEFAIALPVLIFLLLTGIEVGRYTLMHLKMQHASFIMGDIVTRDKNLTQNDLDGFFSAIQHVTTPFDFEQDGVVIVSGISRNEGEANAKVRWQRMGAGNLVAVSDFGAPVANAVLPAGFVLGEGESLIVVEVFFENQEFLLGFVPLQVIQKTTYYRPRLGSLDTLIGG